MKILIQKEKEKEKKTTLYIISVLSIISRKKREIIC